MRAVFGRLGCEGRIAHGRAAHRFIAGHHAARQKARVIGVDDELKIAVDAALLHAPPDGDLRVFQVQHIHQAPHALPGGEPQRGTGDHAKQPIPTHDQREQLGVFGAAAVAQLAIGQHQLQVFDVGAQWLHAQAASMRVG